VLTSLLLSELTRNFTSVLDGFDNCEDYTPLNLSVQNHAIQHLRQSNAAQWDNYLNQQLSKLRKKVFYGGYLEDRFLYDRSDNFSGSTERRSIHLGLDLWCAAYTKVKAPLEGKVHSFQNNAAYGDYGPTIILEHSVDHNTFYTLYGHLSETSLKNLQLGYVVAKGEIFCELGNYPINGDYAPHLHFQIIIDVQNKFGDYPGVCSRNEVDYYSTNCPDPNVLLKIPV
jgi:murein DD-endopeptidase MepM/ murein hydrolase activator NlpD